MILYICFIKESTIKNTYVKPSKPKPPPIDEGPAVKSSIADKKSVVKMEPAKDFGNYSPLNSAALLLGTFLKLCIIFLSKIFHYRGMY